MIPRLVFLRIACLPVAAGNKLVPGLCCRCDELGQNRCGQRVRVLVAHELQLIAKWS
jgi:hypothetical protein